MTVLIKRSQVSPQIFNFRRKIVWISLLWLLAQVAQSQDFKVVGYLPTYRFDLKDNIKYEYLTHLNIAFANPDAQGKLQTNGRDITPIVELAHSYDLGVFIALAGGGVPLSVWEKWIRPNYRSKFIHHIMDYAIHHNLDGIDVDIEWNTVNEDYSGFVLDLIDSSHKHNLEVSAALPGIYRYPEISDEALNAFDWINMMVYDLTGPWAPYQSGPHSPYSFALDAIAYWKDQGVTPERLTLGMPFYGYDFTNPADVFAITYADLIRNNLALSNQDQIGLVYYNGQGTISRKTQLALEELSGVMIWELGQDYFDEQYSLLQVIHEAIQNTTTYTVERQPEIFLKYYPNPFQNFIKLQNNIAKDLHVKLIDLLGNPHYSIKVSKNATAEINAYGLPAGAYLLKVTAEDKTYPFKIIKG